MTLLRRSFCRWWQPPRKPSERQEERSVTAGYCLLGAVENLPIEEVTKQSDTNVVGVGRAIQAALPHTRAQGGGTIAICSSPAGALL